MNSKDNMGYGSVGHKGISPLIAAVLLIAITVAIATLVTGWVSSVTRSTQASVENRTSEATYCASASIAIDQVYLVGNGTARVVVRNSGGADDLVLSNVTVFNATGSQFSSAAVPITLDRGESYTFTISTTGIAVMHISGCPAAFSKALATTNCGGVSAAFDRTPKCA